MAYTSDLPSASRRHREAADTLFETNRRDVAGYLYGIAAECAVKSIMIDVGMRPLSNEKRGDDPFFAHFPELRTMLRDRLHGRNSAVLRKFIENDQFLSQWDTKMRYCNGNEIEDAWVTRWKEQAHQIIASIGT